VIWIKLIIIVVIIISIIIDNYSQKWLDMILDLLRFVRNKILKSRNNCYLNICGSSNRRGIDER